MNYTVAFIFSEDLKRVLMIEKIKGPYPGCLNGIGGKIENSDANEFCGAFREIEEETGLESKDLKHFVFLTKLSFPYGVELNVFATVLCNGSKPRQMEEEKLKWCTIDEDLLDVRNKKLAGDGNIPYFINYGIILIKESIKKEEK